MNKRDLFNDITNKVINTIKSGVLPWQKPWVNGLPQNMFSKHIYNGINFLLLSFDNVAFPNYFTFLQAQQHNKKIKKNSKGRLIIFYKLHEIKTEDEIITFPYLKYSYVFNVEDLEDFEPPIPQLKKPIEILNQIKSNHEINFVQNSSQGCFYNVTKDFISTPNVSYFVNEEKYFSSLFHELIHWTGKEGRLNRFKKNDDDYHLYAHEELVAELGSSFLCGLCGINSVEETSSYIDFWLNKAKLDISFVPKCAILAQKAINFLLNNSFTN